MDTISIATYIGVIVVAILSILVCVYVYKILRVKRRVRVQKKPITPKIESVVAEPIKHKKPLFKKMHIKRKSREAKQYDIWK